MYELIVQTIKRIYPINEFQEAIIKLLESVGVFLIQAPTGSGKSTQVPQIIWNILENGKRKYKRITITGPTRTGVSAVANQVAKEIGCKVGEIVGFKTGYEKVYSDETEILYTTEACELMNELYNSNINYEETVIILDEFQENGIPTEALAAWFKKLIDSGVKLKLILMSASIDTEKVCKFFGNIPMLDVPGKLYEITEYRRKPNEFESSIAELLKQDRNVLAFVPGKREIDNTAEALLKMDLDVNILRLHGDLPLSEQQIVFETPTKPTVVIATNIAQTSITIPYIDAVVDSGLERRMQNIDGLDTLAIGVISRSDYIQRRGRAGRTKPGIYIWCNSTPIEELREYPIPDIETGNIDQIVLQLGSIGIDARTLTFMHQPPLEKIEASQKTLRMLGAFDEDNQITEYGKIMAKLPISVRYSRMLVEAQKRDVLSDVLTIASLMEFGGIKNTNVSYEGFSNERKSDCLAELDCFNTVKRKVMDGEYAFDGIQERNYYRVIEHRAKLADILYNIYGDVSSSGDRNEILKSCIAGLVEFLYVRESNNWYSKPNDDFKRKIDIYSATLPNMHMVGLPKNISLAHKEANPILYLISWANMVTIPMLEEVAPHLFHIETRNEFKYETNEFLTREIRFFGDVEVSSRDYKLSDSSEKRKALAKWLATVTIDDEAFAKLKSRLDKTLKKAIDRNYGIFSDVEEATEFYTRKLDEFSTNSLPNLRRCKDFAFLAF